MKYSGNKPKERAEHVLCWNSMRTMVYVLGFF